MVNDKQAGTPIETSDAQRDRAAIKRYDTQYDESRIREVKKESTGFAVTSSDGWTLWTRENNPIEPKPGMVMRQYGRGLGHSVRGLDIDGVEFFYETEEEEKVRFARECQKKQDKQRQEFEQNRAEMDAKYDALPEVFRQRIDKFRINNPDFRWEYEPYEMFCCEQAVLIAGACGSATEIDAFYKLDWKDQLAKVPGLSDQHSGNTFVCACRLAALYINCPDGVVKSHGALAPLVGSKEYGCIPRDADTPESGSEVSGQGPDSADSTPSPITQQIPPVKGDKGAVV